VIGVSVDDERKDALDFATNLQLTFLLEWDENHTIARKWKVKTMPSAYVVDATGIVRFVQNGYEEGSVDVLEAEALELM
jgi:peroxiredoxin